MRCTTSALTTAILGAVLTSSTISAQQFQPSESPSPNSPAASATEPQPAPGSQSSTVADGNTDALTGMAATRGARYLLRNGLDYINYQEYERALSYLREAEVRQKQLNEPERLALKQAIERAQRGLREAIGSQSPYALSKRSRRTGGFAPARPDTEIVSRPNSAEPGARQAVRRSLNSREGDDLGQPIRLAGGEMASQSPVTAATSSAPEPSPGPGTDGMPQPLPIGSDQPAQLPDMPSASQLPEQTVSSKESAGGTAVNSQSPAQTEVAPITTGKRAAPADAPPLEAGIKTEPTKQETTDSVVASSTSSPSNPRLDPAAAAQADLLSPLPPLTPAADAPATSTNPPIPQAAPEVRSPTQAAVQDPAQTRSAALDPNLATAGQDGIQKTANLQPSELNASESQAVPLSDTHSVFPSPPVVKPPDQPINSSQTPPKEATAAPPLDRSGLPPTARADDKSSATADLQTVQASSPPAGGESPLAPEAAPSGIGPTAPASPADPIVRPTTPIDPVDGSAFPAHSTSNTQGTAGSAASPSPINLESHTDMSSSASSIQSTAKSPSDAVPLPPLGSDSTPANTPAPSPGPASAPAPDTAVQASTASTETGVQLKETNTDELPPLPGQKAFETNPSTETAKTNAITESTPPTVAAANEELPPLPSNSEREVDPKNSAEPLPSPAEELPPLPSAGAAANPNGASLPHVRTAITTSSLVTSEQPAPVTEPGPGEQNSSPGSASRESVLQTMPQPSQSNDPARTGPANGALELGQTNPASSSTPSAAPVPVPTDVGTAARIEEPNSGPTRTGAVSSPLLESSGARSTASPSDGVPNAGLAGTPESVPGAKAPQSSLDAETFIPERKTAPSTLRPELQRRVEEIARKQDSEENEYVRSLSQPPSAPLGVGGPDKTQTQVDISRAPSPAEARPIRAIPVPEDWVPLARREWSPSRKYWAAAATCHMPLYFQDTMLERYGHSAETYFGPAGRFLTYPVDDPKQSTQRNQIIQPAFSVGLFAWQVITWPYALIMDPPWEAQYDLGYWRPGDRIPTDLYYQPLHGTGPPLRGRNY